MNNNLQDIIKLKDVNQLKKLASRMKSEIRTKAKKATARGYDLPFQHDISKVESLKGKNFDDAMTIFKELKMIKESESYNITNVKKIVKEYADVKKLKTPKTTKEISDYYNKYVEEVTNTDNIIPSTVKFEYYKVMYNEPGGYSKGKSKLEQVSDMEKIMIERGYIKVEPQNGDKNEQA